jgi:hypothetical protein
MLHLHTLSTYQHVIAARQIPPDNRFELVYVRKHMEVHRLLNRKLPVDDAAR